MGASQYNAAMAVKIYPIDAGSFRVDGGAMFGVVPRVLWQQQYQPDDLNRIAQVLRSMLIIDGDRNILVDPGIGNWPDAKFIKTYDVQEPDFDFDRALAAYNLACEDITDVILTHLHFDHAGGFVSRKNSQIVPTFAKARAWVQKEHLLWAQNPSPKDRASFMEIYLRPLLEWSRLELLEGQDQITNNVSVIPFYGHTPAMQTVMVLTETGKHFFASDLLPDATHLHIPYISAYDNKAVVTAEEKQKVLAEACRQKWTIYFYHDPHVSKGRAVLDDGKFAVMPI